MRDFLKKNKEYILHTFTFLLGLSLILAIFLPMVSALRLVFGGFFMLFLPGFSLSFVFYKKETITRPERYLVSFVLTIITVPLIIYLLSLNGMSVNLLNSSLITLVVIIFGFVLSWRT